MAPTRSKKRKSTESTASSVDMQSFPAPPRMVPTKTRSPIRTPPSNRSPIKKARAGITLGQKQALIDNLQLEITERARKLRAQYMLQAQGLRTRIEIRVNRIPTALRRAKMGELLQKHSETAAKSTNRNPQRVVKANSPAKNRMEDLREQSRASPSPRRAPKRLSDEISSIDKENEDVENPKKRLRPGPPSHGSSREKLQPSQVLSPRSANSRTLPRSPIRPSGPPSKSVPARPASPLKPSATGGPSSMLTNMVEKAKSTRGPAARKAPTTIAATAGAGRGRRAPAAPAPAPRAARGRGSAISDSSDSSNATVVRKPMPPRKEPAKRTVMSTLKGMGGGGTRKAPAAKAAAPATGTRVLRKRN
ncbi:Uncharacterized protein BP5553_02948 [Venustampulla echinocandica]|uniref:Borealin N-terminal domain-containing protein n=1 Tax=Venustampulla echinocandica TaxID=2656787 RepID=A0A370TSY4_9HELO|nr:Uncharacterized protein BP5553_02948 [Venustampulla echinocandica]RDL38608.1 Uncharacterized protein BP5553_02948 [Venustampulla echinocandica]